jgi:hypothetical protein
MDGIKEKTTDGVEPTQKTVSYEEYQKIVEENNSLKEREKEITKGAQRSNWINQV